MPWLYDAQQPYGLAVLDLPSLNWWSLSHGASTDANVTTHDVAAAYGSAHDDEP